MRPIDRSPTAIGGGIAVATALVALLPGVYDATALAVGAVGFLAFVGGVARGATRVVTLGATGLLGGALLAGLSGVPPGPLLAAVTATVVAWDAAGTAIALGDQLGRDADTSRVEAVHVGATAAVGALGAGGGYAVYALATGGRSAVALLCFLLAAVLLASAVR